MPAARSDAEAEIRKRVVTKLRRCRPEARIIHEINMGGGVNRADVMAISPAEIITVEIKSEKDKLDRLPDQIATMRKCSQITRTAQAVAQHHNAAPVTLPSVPWEKEKNDE